MDPLNTRCVPVTAAKEKVSQAFPSSKKETFRVAYVKKVMPRDRFNKLTQYLRINNKIQNDDMLQTHLKQEDMQKGEEQLTCLKPTLFT